MESESLGGVPPRAKRDYDTPAVPRRLRALAMRLVSIREEERTRVARDLHDELGQSLTALKIQLAMLGSELPEPRQPCQRRLEAMSEMVNQMVQTVRRISTELRPAVLDHLGLIAGMEWQAADFQARTGIACELDADLREGAASPAAATAIFRIVQEALTNVVRHAQARRVRVHLAARDGDILLEISDDGVGLGDPVARPALPLGLLGIRERAAMLGGRAAVVGPPGRGTTVRVRIPLVTPAGADGP
jgi:signal transduction histidine kinase